MPLSDHLSESESITDEKDWLAPSSRHAEKVFYLTEYAYPATSLVVPDWGSRSPGSDVRVTRVSASVGLICPLRRE